MRSTGGKFWYAVAGLGTAAAVAYWFASGRGEWFGTMTLGAIVLGALLLGITAGAIDDGDVPATAAGDEVPVRRTLPALWPPLTGLGAALALVGLAGKTPLLYVGLGLVALVGIEWLVSGWAERATGDHEVNRRARDQVMAPLEIPVLGVIAIAFVVLSMSRVFLALSKDGTIIAAGLLATAILVLGTLVASRPALKSSMITGLLAAGAVAVLAAGIVGLDAGTREFEHHAPEGEEHGDDAEDPTPNSRESDDHSAEQS